MELTIFESAEFGQVRTYTEEDGTILYCGTDIARALEYNQPHKAVKRHCKRKVKRRTPHPQSPDKEIEMVFVPESDVYRLILRSHLPAARKFEEWVFEEILPSINSCGIYATDAALDYIIDNPDYLVQVADQLLKDRGESPKDEKAKNWDGFINKYRSLINAIAETTPEEIDDWVKYFYDMETSGGEGFEIPPDYQNLRKFKITTYTNPDFGEIRTTLSETRAPLFCGTDVAQALGYDNPRDAVLRLCRCVGKRTVPHPQSPDKEIEMTFVPESDVYRLIINSTLPTAEKFEAWVVEEVLPAIRKESKNYV